MKQPEQPMCPPRRVGDFLEDVVENGTLTPAGRGADLGGFKLIFYWLCWRMPQAGADFLEGVW